MLFLRRQTLEQLPFYTLRAVRVIGVFLVIATSALGAAPSQKADTDVAALLREECRRFRGDPDFGPGMTYHEILDLKELVGEAMASLPAEWCRLYFVGDEGRESVCAFPSDRIELIGAPSAQGVEFPHNTVVVVLDGFSLAYRPEGGIDVQKDAISALDNLATRLSLDATIVKTVREDLIRSSRLALLTEAAQVATRPLPATDTDVKDLIRGTVMRYIGGYLPTSHCWRLTVNDRTVVCLSGATIESSPYSIVYVFGGDEVRYALDVTLDRKLVTSVVPEADQKRMRVELCTVIRSALRYGLREPYTTE